MRQQYSTLETTTIYSHQNKFVKSTIINFFYNDVTFTKLVPKRVRDCGKFPLSVHCSVLWKLRKFTLTIFDKNFVKAKLLLKNRFHDISRFSENFLQCILKYIFNSYRNFRETTFKN